MGLSVASLSPISAASYVSTVPMNYAVDNESEVSGAYIESRRANSVNGVDAAPPVRYANATVQEDDNPLNVDRTASLQRNQAANRAYNAIASNFGGAATSYGASGAAASYQTVGQNLDLFA